ncbi:MAG TPA: TrbG/VirB9 family P-type conjugative transfer protein [Croceibacterium sp.]|jgi:type IV secretion system protein VirB9
MNRLLPAAALGLLALATPLRAEDPRLLSRLFDANAVVRIEGRPNVETTIRFADDELIENVAIGDSNGWQVTPNKRANLLFVKPLNAKAATNMTVVTSDHTYFFDLVASARGGQPVYELAFTYPKQAKPAAAKPATGERPNAAELAAASDPQAIVDPAQLNFSWAGSGDHKLLPARIYDDGTSTYLAWPAGTPVPAILVKDRQGTEGPVNFAVHGDVIVVENVPRQIILRSGKQLATIDNHGPERAPPALAQADEVKK